MTNSIWTMATLASILALAAAVALAVVLFARTTPETVARFCARQQITMTRANVPMLAAALVTTKMWRHTGLAIALLAGVVWAVYQGRLELNFSLAFLGWFLGAVAAQWQINAPVDPAARRAVVLDRRTLASFVHPVNRWLLWASCAIVAGLALAVLPQAVHLHRLRWWLAIVAEIVLGGIVLAAGVRRVCDRARPQERGLVETDTALRRYSLNVLAGSAIALSTAPISQLLVTMSDPSQGSAAAGDLALLVVVVGLYIGWLVGNSARAPRESGPQPDGPEQGHHDLGRHDLAQGEQHA